LSTNEFRLPRHVVPQHYDIRLELDLESLTFEGSVGIDLGVISPVSEIVLNTAEIDIITAVLRSEDSVVEVADIGYDQKFERATLNLVSEIRPGSYRLEIQHSGIINDQLRGLYQSIYRDVEGNEHMIATSQCQSTDARRIFPCWDEPDFKATFKTTMVVAHGLEAYSNSGEIGRQTTSDGRNEIEFAQTMKMSPYLLAFTAGPFEATDPVEVRGTPIRIIVPKGNLALTAVALENAVFCFEYLSDYYGIPYPGDKLDHIAIPDFAAGAMENVGLITYRDSYLVIDQVKASQSELGQSLSVIAHEVAHQWFGNLVTMAWWEGAWLNEAFASFMELKAANDMHPEWKRWLAFANEEVPWAMSTDQLATTRPIEFEVNAPEEVDEMFDSITYGKGSAVLWMLEQFIGVEQFRDGVGRYLRKHQYANTVTGDLWEGLDAASEWPVSEIMNTWVYQRGFPQLDVKRIDGGIRLAQRRYLAFPDETDTTIWKVPIQLRGSAAGAPFEIKVLLEHDEQLVEIDGDLEWVVANAGGYGFYRTRYSTDLFAPLLQHLHSLDHVERYSLVSDTLAFVRNGQVDSSRFLDLIAGFKTESEHAIWSVITGGLGLLEHHALSDEARDGFQSFVCDLVMGALERLGWAVAPTDSDLDRRLRGTLIATLGNLGNSPEAVDFSRDVAARLLAGDHIDPELATSALAVYAKHGGPKEYDLLWAAYETSATPLDQVRYLRSVTMFETEEQAIATLEKVIEGQIRAQDGFWVFARLLMGAVGPAAWKAARTRWNEVLEAMPGMTRPRIAEGLSALSQPEVAADVKAFFAEHPVPEATRSLAQNLEKLDSNVALRERETPVLTEYFARS
jgi:puromycin-sensitive aminopeptidase